MLFCCVISETIPQLETLTPEEKLILSNELWAEAQKAMSGKAEIRPDLLNRLRQRLSEYEENRDDVVTWENIKARYRKHHAQSEAHGGT